MFMCVCMLLCMCLNVGGACTHTHKKRFWGSNLDSCCKASTFLTVTSPEFWTVDFRLLHNLWGSDFVESCCADDSCFPALG